MDETTALISALATLSTALAGWVGIREWLIRKNGKARIEEPDRHAMVEENFIKTSLDNQREMIRLIRSSSESLTTLNNNVLEGNRRTEDIWRRVQ